MVFKKKKRKTEKRGDAESGGSAGCDSTSQSQTQKSKYASQRPASVESVDGDGCSSRKPDARRDCLTAPADILRSRQGWGAGEGGQLPSNPNANPTLPLRGQRFRYRSRRLLSPRLSQQNISVNLLPPPVSQSSLFFACLDSVLNKSRISSLLKREK